MTDDTPTTVNTTTLGQLTAQTMEEINERFDGTDYTIRTACLVVEMDSPERGGIIVKSSEDRPYVICALLNEAWERVDQIRSSYLNPADTRGDDLEDDGE